MSIVQQCCICGTEKALDQFNKNKNLKFGREYQCRDCKQQRDKEWYKKSPHVRLRYQKYKYNSDPMYKLKRLVRGATHRYIKGSKSKHTEEIIGCSWEELKEHLESNFSIGMTWENHGEWHIDHIVPLSTAKTEEEIYKLNHYTNLQPLWAKDNLQKGNRYAKNVV